MGHLEQSTDPHKEGGMTGLHFSSTHAHHMGNLCMGHAGSLCLPSVSGSSKVWLLGTTAF